MVNHKRKDYLATLFGCSALAWWSKSERYYSTIMSNERTRKRRTRVRGQVTDETTRSLPISPQSSVNKSMRLPIFINLGPIFMAQFHFSFCFYFIILVVNWRLEIGLSKIPMKLLKIVWHCRRLYQFIRADCYDPVLAFRLLKIGVRLSKILIISIKIGLDCSRLGFFLLCFN